MPELPEVETTRRGLVPVLEGQKIGKVIKRRDKIRIPIPEDFVKRIEGQYVRHIKRRAKYLQIFLQSDDVIICHLGMSGKFIIKHKDNENIDNHHHHHHHHSTSEDDDVLFGNMENKQILPKNISTSFWGKNINFK